MEMCDVLYQKFTKQFKKDSYNSIIASILVENRYGFLSEDQIEKLFVTKLLGRNRYPDTRKYVANFIKTNSTKFVIEFDETEDLIYQLDFNKLGNGKVSRTFSCQVKRAKDNITYCEACGILEKYNKMELDHWRPYSKHNLQLGSSISSLSNCVKLCIACNQIKKDKPSYILVEKGRMEYNNWILLERKMYNEGNMITPCEYGYSLYLE
jgi:hypothetical protein